MKFFKYIRWIMVGLSGAFRYMGHDRLAMTAIVIWMSTAFIKDIYTDFIAKAPDDDKSNLLH